MIRRAFGLNLPWFCPFAGVIAVCVLAYSVAQAQEVGTARGATRPAVPAAATIPSAENKVSDSLPTLRWKNGDELPGALVGVAEDRLLWKSEVFAQPLAIDLEYLASVTTPRPATADAAVGPLRFTLTNGNQFDGALVGVSNTLLQVRSSRLGQVALLRSSLRSITRVDRAELVDLTKSGGERWQSLDRQWKTLPGELAGWKKDDSGQVRTTVAGARLALPVNLPSVCEIELALKWQAAPLAFTLSYGMPADLKRRTGNLQIDTWADELVVQSSARPDDFEPLMTIAPQTKDMHLRILWNRLTGRIAVYDSSFHQLAEIVGKPDSDVRGSLFLENRGTDLTITSLRVGMWDGQQRAAPANQDRIGTLNGTELYGNITGLDAEGFLLIDDADGHPQRVAVAQLSDFVVRSPVAADDPTAGTKGTDVTFYDGTQLHGKLISIRDGAARLQTVFAEDPVTVSLTGLRQMLLPATGTTALPAAPFVLTIGEHRMLGTLAAAGTALGWQPAGSRDVIPLSANGSMRITRADPKTNAPNETSTPEVKQFDDAVYLQNGDRVPCNVAVVDETALRVTPSFGEATSIPRDEVRAIELNTKITGPISGFRDARWEFLDRQPNATEMTAERVVIRGRADLNHPDLMKDGGFELDAEWSHTTQSSLIIYLFTANGVRQATAPRVQISSMAGQLSINVIVNSNVQSFGFSLNGKDRTRLGFFTEGAELKLFVDGVPLCSTPLPERRPDGRGVSLACTTTTAALNVVNPGRGRGGAAQPGVQPAVNMPQQKNDFLIALSNLRSGSATSAVRGMALTDKERQQFLLVPRSRRDHPPQNALVAQNGDLLRGELIELGKSAAQFRSGLDEMALPRERLAGIVWLTQPDKAEPPVPPAGLAQAVLRNGSILSLAIEKAAGNEIIGRHPVLGLCRITLDAINELRVGKQQEPGKLLAYSEWTLISAKEPVIPGAGGEGEGEGFGTFSPLVGKQAEDFSLVTLDGKAFKLSDHKDKVVVLDFWATWCMYCVQEMPDLIKVTSDFKPEDVIFIAVNEQENTTAIKTFMKAHDWNFQVVLDSNGKIGKQYQVEGLPQTVVIGRGGKIERVNLGVHPNFEVELKKTLEELVTGEKKTDEDADE